MRLAPLLVVAGLWLAASPPAAAQDAEQGAQEAELDEDRSATSAPVHTVPAERLDVPEEARLLDAPTLGSTREGHRVRLYLHSEAEHDTARVHRTGGEDLGEDLRCDTPCSFVVPPGEYRVYFSAVTKDATLTLHDHDVVAEGHPDDTWELVGGIGSAVVGAIVLAVAFVTGKGICWDPTDPACDLQNGPVALGIGGFLIGLGLFLGLDSPGYVEVETI